MAFIKCTDVIVPPVRIVSLVPSISETLHDLGVGHNVVGITKFCVHPVHWKHQKAIVGGTKTVSVPSIYQLAPDLIIANKEENVKEQIEILAKDFPVLLTNVSTLNEALDLVVQLGIACHCSELAYHIVQQIKEGLQKLDNPKVMVTAACFIWRKPFMAAGGDTFISDWMRHLGAINVFQAYNRYPVLPNEHYLPSETKLLLLTTEPYPFQQKHMSEIQAKYPKVAIQLIDGEMITWYGSRMLKAVDYFSSYVFLNQKL